MSAQILEGSSRLDDTCSWLTDAESTISFVCRQVTAGKMTPEGALLKIHVDALPTIASARNGVHWVADELRAAEALKEGETKK